MLVVHFRETCDFVSHLNTKSVPTKNLCAF